MYDGNLNDFDAVNSYLDGETIDNNGTQHGLPTTPQDQTPHKDGLFGRDYNAGFDHGQVGRQGTDVLNTRQDGDHYDVIEQDPGTGNMYHNRVHDPGAGGGL
ncbi:hypothetical protein [Haloarcula sp. CGMCC 1.2071]|uniref:hypothetical protein n=1 Tax=Haloarcula sp. CGMCC 1.2071 TaxID=3111454 RepID=UPI00300F2982